MSEVGDAYLFHVGEGIEHRHYGGDAGHDLICAERVVIHPGDFADVDCGVTVALPPDTWGLITGRSSTFRKHRLHVVQGVIDNGYRGPLKTGLCNLGEKTHVVEVGDQLAQLIVMPLLKPVLWRAERLEDLPRGDRGEAAYGSTDKAES